MSEIKNIYQRINEVMKEVKYVQKDASIQGYKAVTHDQVVSVARQQFVDNGIVMSVSQLEGKFDDPLNGGKMRLYTGKYEISLINIDDPEQRVTVVIEAHALDHGDKAPGKCATYATKTAILKLLWLETGENDESREEMRNPSLISQEDVELLAPHIMVQVDGNWQWTNIGQKLATQFQFNGVDQIRSKDVAKIKRALKL